MKPLGSPPIPGIHSAHCQSSVVAYQIIRARVGRSSWAEDEHGVYDYGSAAGLADDYRIDVELLKSV